MNNMDINAWPKMADYPKTEDGWNQYANEWVSRRRKTTGLAQIPIVKGRGLTPKNRTLDK